MKIVQRRTLTWVYLDPQSDVERQLVHWVSGSAAHSPVIDWLRANCRGWSYSNEIAHIKGDEHDFTVLKFCQEDDAVLFRMQWSSKGVEAEVTPASATWRDRTDDPKGLTFAKSCSHRFYRADVKSRGALGGKSVCYWWGSERNAAGFFVGYQTVNGAPTATRIARRKKRDVIEWARRKASQ